MKSMAAVGGAGVAFALVAVGLGLALAREAHSQADRSAAAELSRPADIDRWITVGVTVRVDRQDHTTPRQMRQVLMAPDAYEDFVRTRRYADGTAFAVNFYGLAHNTSHTPPLYHAADEEAFAMEVIDRAHPDGRRFYTFAPGEMRAAALPAGNACAACHNAQASFDGTFAHMYPALARYTTDD
jgi:hypothetical protein